MKGEKLTKTYVWRFQIEKKTFGFHGSYKNIPTL